MKKPLTIIASTLLLLATSLSGQTPPPVPATPMAEPASESSPEATPDIAKKTPDDALPDWHVRRKEFVHQLFGLQAAIETLPGTGFDMARNFPKEWGRTWPGLGKRYWNQYSQFLMSESIEFGVGALHHEDPRYFRLGPDSKTSTRVWHVLKSPWIARDSEDGSRNKLAIGRISGVYGAWFIASRWSPDSVQGIQPFLVWGSFGMVTKSGVNALREFGPDVKKRFHH